MNAPDEILVVEDTSMVLKLLTDILSVEGFQVRSADTGEMAVRSVVSKSPHLILLDIKMPGMDGFEVCRRLKSKGKTRDIPLIFLSAITDFEQKMKGFELGAVDFITKPFQHEELLARVRTHLELSRLRTTLEAQVTERTAQLRIMAGEVEDLYDNAPCGYHSLDKDGVFLRINSTELDWLGYTRNELIGKKKFSDLITPMYRPIFRKNFSIFKTQGFLRDLELEIIRKDGTTFPALLNASGIPDSQGIYLMTRSILSDITKRKQVEEVLRESEEKYRTLFEHTGTALIILEEDTTVSLANNEFATLTGYTKAEIEGNKKSMDFTVPQDKDKILGYHHLRREDPAAAPREYESRFVDKNGRIIRTHNTVAMIPGTAKSIVSFVDITERKQAEAVIKESEEKYRTILETIEDGYYEVNRGGYLTFSNDALTRIYERPREELMGKHSRDYMDSENYKIIERGITQVYQTQKPLKGIQYEIITKNGGRKSLETSVSLMKDSSGKFIGFRGIVRDITGLRRAQRDLEASEKKYRTILETIEDGYYEIDLKGTPLFMNEAVARMSGYSNDELLALNYRNYTDAETSQRLKQVYSQVFQTGESCKGIVHEVTCKDGTKRTIEASISLVRDHSGKPIGFRGITRDITEIRQAEKALQKSEEKYRSIFENAMEGIFQFTPEGRIINVNPALARMHGFASPEEMKTSITDYDNQLFINPEDKIRNQKQLEEQGSVRAHEVQMYKKDGEKIWASFSASTVKDKEGKILYIEGITQDITQRKLAEEALSREISISDSTIDSLPGIFYLFDKQGKFHRWNKNAELISGYSSEEISHMSPLDFFIGEDKKRIVEKIQEAFEKEKGEIAIEAEFVSKDGHKAPYFFTGRGLVLDHTQYLVGVGIDISDRKKAEEELRESMDKLHKIMGGIIKAMTLTVEKRDPYTAGHQQRVSHLARAIAQEMGLSKDQIEGIRMAGLVHDLGKISVPAEILSKPTQLSALEFGLIKVHPQTSHDILKDIEFPWPIALIVLQHHERMNGSGYPQGLKGEEILLESRILAVADVVEAIASHRPYRPAYGIEVSLDEISKNRGLLYDPEVVDACLRLFKEKGFKLE